MKLRPVVNGYNFYCPGCDRSHGFSTAPGGWQFDGNLDHPTVQPSLLTTNRDPNYRCHLYLTAGKLEFLNDCSHELAGQIVELPDWTYDTGIGD